MKKTALFLAVWTMTMSLCGCSTVCRIPEPGVPMSASQLTEEKEPAELVVLAAWEW